MGILEIDAKNFLTEYNGSNNLLLDWQYKQLNIKSFKLTRTQSDYVVKYHNVQPKVAKKYLNIVESFGKQLQTERVLSEPVSKIWCEKLLCDSDKAYNVWGKIHESDKLNSFWIPKFAILVDEKKFTGVIDYSKYNVRPPMEHQKVAIEKLLCNDKYILADDMGVGKSTSAVLASLESGAKKILIICPSSLKINWLREIEIYTNRPTFIMSGSKWGSTFDYYIVNYDIVKNYHSDEKDEREKSVLLKQKFDLAIVDEAHFLSNPQANRSRLIGDLLMDIPKVWLLTGTPMTSRPINYFNLLKIVKSPLAENWQHYVKRYCGGYQFQSGNRKIWNTGGATNLDELRERTKCITLRRLKEDILTLPEKIVSPVYLELGNMQFYNDEMDEFIKITEEDKTKDKVSIDLSKLMKLRQMIAFEKIPFTCELIDRFLELDQKVIVFTNFTSTLDTIYEKYKNIAVVVDGRMNNIKRQNSIDRFQSDKKVKVFIGNIIAAGAGITLTSADGVIMNDLSFVPAHHAQAEDRAHRIGVKHSVNVYYPVFENTIEMNVYNILQRKKNIIDQVMGDGEYSESFGKELLSTILKKPLD